MAAQDLQLTGIANVNWNVFFLLETDILHFRIDHAIPSGPMAKDTEFFSKKCSGSFLQMMLLLMQNLIVYRLFDTRTCRLRYGRNVCYPYMKNI